MTSKTRSLTVVIAAALVLQAGGPALAQTSAPPKPDAGAPAPKTAAAPAPKPAVVPAKLFASAEDATQALVDAVRAGDAKAMVTVLGGQGRALVSSGDAVADRQGRENFVQAYDAAHRLIPYGSYSVLQLGADNWPFPIPIVKAGERWRFDTKQGREEILARRIGRNELYTIQTCLAYVDAQREYYAEDRNADGILEYAQQFASSPGKRDGLYWPAQPGEPLSPLGELVARARAEGYRRDASGGPTPLHGYFYRILTAQGPAAPDGAYEYIVSGHMIAGFALVAYPAQYGTSGVMTFIVNHDGVVYQNDLGPKTRELARAMRVFEPNSAWAKTDATDVTLTSASASR